jgi:hypothetical protein
MKAENRLMSRNAYLKQIGVFPKITNEGNICIVWSNEYL